VSLIASASLQELWAPLGRGRFEEEVFMVIVGYIDESYSDEKPPLTFGLACLFAYGAEWTWIDLAWKKLLDDKNEELTAAGRKPLTRVHAVDMSNFAEDFEGWTPEERIEFTAKIVSIFARHHVFGMGCTMSLQDVAEIWGVKDPKLFAYFTILKYLMLQTGDLLRELFSSLQPVTLIHDRCAYDTTYLNAFNSMINDLKFRDRKLFTAIAPQGWEMCRPLQVADFVAYEVMKEAHRLEPDVRRIKERNRRISLSELLKQNSFRGIAYHIEKESIQQIKDNVDARTKARLEAEQGVAEIQQSHEGNTSSQSTGS